jgi:PAS domain S-box-containing protein
MSDAEIPGAPAVEAGVFAAALTETTQSLVCVLDPNGVILLFNDACERATGFRREEVVGRDARESVIPDEEADAFAGVLLHIAATRHSSPQVGHWLTKDGGRLLIAWSNKPVIAQDGTLEYIVTSGLDLTRREREGYDPLDGDVEAKLVEVSLLAQEQRALRRVATLVAAEAPPERVYNAVSEECARVLEVRASAVFRYEGDDTATIVGRYGRDGVTAFQLGERLPAAENTTVGKVLTTGAPARIDDYTSLTGELPELMASIGYKSTVAAPISVAGILWGTVVVASEETLPPESEARLAAFCELVSLAVASAQAKADLQSSRRRLVSAGDEERRRLERNLHDGAQQRLVALALTLRLARAKVDNAPEGAASLMEEASQQLEQALDELRELARGLHPAILTARGLAHALPALAGGLPIPVEVEVDEERYEPALEATVYFIAAEALTNVVKHAKADGARVTVTRGETTLRLEITDDGCGGADPSGGSGILGLHDRASAIGGQLSVISSPGRGTVVTATLPLEPLL